MNKEKVKKNKQVRRHKKVRAKISGTGSCHRLSVFRSNKEMYLQLIDDKKGKTVVSAHSRDVKKSVSASALSSTKTTEGKKAMNDNDKKVAVGFELGKLIAKKALAKKIKQVVFDRGGYKYHGRVKAVADGAREGGLEF